MLNGPRKDCKVLPPTTAFVTEGFLIKSGLCCSRCKQLLSLVTCFRTPWSLDAYLLKYA